MQTTSYAIGLGSNRPRGRAAPAAVIAAVIVAMAAEMRVVARSPIIRSDPLGPGGRRYANAAALIETPLAPPALLARLKRIERNFGRRAGRRWGARVIDLDILLWSGGRWRARRLTIPHAALADRAFVLGPLDSIAPHWRVPGRNLTVRQLTARLRRAMPVDRGAARS